MEAFGTLYHKKCAPKNAKKPKTLASIIASRWLLAQIDIIVCTLRWTEPTPGSHVILFPNDAFEDLLEVSNFCKKSFGNEVGETIAEISLHQKKGEPDEDPWGDLALQVRYSSGEGLYQRDCPVFVKHGIARV
jgi:hypothetical protein